MFIAFPLIGLAQFVSAQTTRRNDQNRRRERRMMGIGTPMSHNKTPFICSLRDVPQTKPVAGMLVPT
jgi:hypothetical protein